MEIEILRVIEFAEHQFPGNLFPHLHFEQWFPISVLSERWNISIQTYMYIETRREARERERERDREEGLYIYKERERERERERDSERERARTA